jgi:hypothetical protein
LPGGGKFPCAPICGETKKSFVYFGLVGGPALALTASDTVGRAGQRYEAYRPGVHRHVRVSQFGK